VIEVAQDDHKTASVVWSQSMFYRNFDIIECDERSSRSGAIRSIDVLRFYALAALNEKDHHSFVCSASSNEVVREVAIRDPFLPSPNLANSCIKTKYQLTLVPK